MVKRVVREELVTFSTLCVSHLLYMFVKGGVTLHEALILLCTRMVLTVLTIGVQSEFMILEL